MAAKQSLRDYQLDLSARLQRAATEVSAASKLGLESGGGAWLVDLTEAGEMIPVSPITAVPLALPWFLGVANIRGNLYSVTDFGAFLGGEATAITDRRGCADQRPLPRRVRAARRSLARSAQGRRAGAAPGRRQVEVDARRIHRRGGKALARAECPSAGAGP
jgi:hypothetical protein